MYYFILLSKWTSIRTHLSSINFKYKSVKKKKKKTREEKRKNQLKETPADTK